MRLHVLDGGTGQYLRLGGGEKKDDDDEDDEEDEDDKGRKAGGKKQKGRRGSRANAPPAGPVTVAPATTRAYPLRGNAAVAQWLQVRRSRRKDSGRSGTGGLTAGGGLGDDVAGAGCGGALPCAAPA